MPFVKVVSPLYASFEGPVSTLYAELVARARAGAARQRLPALQSLLQPHPQALDEVERALHAVALR
jgi:hypothetical protein